jgi:hypothetical protein
MIGKVAQSMIQASFSIDPSPPAKTSRGPDISLIFSPPAIMQEWLVETPCNKAYVTSERDKWKLKRQDVKESSHSPIQQYLDKYKRTKKFQVQEELEQSNETLLCTISDKSHRGGAAKC